MRRIRIDTSQARAIVEDAEVPRPAHGEVAVDVVFAGINMKDVKQRRGAATASRAGVTLPGFEVAGTVREIGSGVEGIALGDAVVARASVAGFADVAICRRELMVRLEQADEELLRRSAASFIAGVTAALLLEELARPRVGDSLLVHGAAGAVGTALGQFGRHLGLDPLIGTVGDEAKSEAARNAGYTHVLVRDTMADGVREITGGRGVDLVADPIGGEIRRTSFDLLAPMGRLLAYGRTGTDDEGLPAGQCLRGDNRSFMGMSFGSLSEQDPGLCAEVAARVAQAIIDGIVGVPVHGTYALDEVDAAMDAIESRATTGKLVVALSEGR